MISLFLKMTKMIMTGIETIIHPVSCNGTELIRLSVENW